MSNDKDNITETNKVNILGLIIGILLILFGFLWIAVKMGWIPNILLDIFPQVIITLVGIFILYKSLKN